MTQSKVHGDNVNHLNLQRRSYGTQNRDVEEKTEEQWTGNAFGLPFTYQIQKKTKSQATVYPSPKVP